VLDLEGDILMIRLRYIIKGGDVTIEPAVKRLQLFLVHENPVGGPAGED